MVGKGSEKREQAEFHNELIGQGIEHKVGVQTR